MDEEIKKQAKKIMDDFMAALDKVGEETDNQKNICVEREKNVREGSKKKKDESFRDRVFSNAPKHDHEHIIAEKKGW